MTVEPPYLLFLGDARDALAAKTASGIATWRPEWCIGQVRLDGCNADIGLAEMTPAEAVRRGARTLVLGVANQGGFVQDNWTAAIVDALDHGLHVASGLHARLADIPGVHAAAERAGRRLFDVRQPPEAFKTGTGTKRTGKRLLTVGTDCSCGKMYTALAIEREMRGRGIDADFRATGQTGILIAGSGVAVDAVVSDFISGATEWLTPHAAADHWDVIEGQGSLFHPAYAGVSLGLLHGAQADALVLCHEPTRRHARGLPDYALPEIGACIEANLGAARLTNPAARLVGIAVNTGALGAQAAAALARELEDAHGIPCVDPMAMGVGPIVDQLA